MHELYAHVHDLTLTYCISHNTKMHHGQKDGNFGPPPYLKLIVEGLYLVSP